MRMKALAAYLFILFTPASAHVNARQNAGSAQDVTMFNSAELSRFTPANSSNSANHVPVSRIEFAADRACNNYYDSELDTGPSARRVGVATRS